MRGGDAQNCAGQVRMCSKEGVKGGSWPVREDHAHVARVCFGCRHQGPLHTGSQGLMSAWRHRKGRAPPRGGVGQSIRAKRTVRRRERAVLKHTGQEGERGRKQFARDGESAGKGVKHRQRQCPHLVHGIALR